MCHWAQFLTQFKVNGEWHFSESNDTDQKEALIANDVKANLHGAARAQGRTKTIAPVGQARLDGRSQEAPRSSQSLGPNGTSCRHTW